MKGINTFLDSLKLVAVTSIGQLLGTFGVVAVFGALLYALSRITRSLYVNTVGSRIEFIATGWLGIFIQRLGQFLFIKFFFHKITEMKWFDPDARSGGFGRIDHSFSKRNLYQKIGNLFISISPLIVGVIAMYAALYYLLPDSTRMFDLIQKESLVLAKASESSIAGILQAVGVSISTTLSTIFSLENFINWKFYIFLYISLCIASHMELTTYELKGAVSGIVAVIILVFSTNLTAPVLGGGVQFVVSGAVNFIVSLANTLGLKGLKPMASQFNVVDYSVWINRNMGFLIALSIYATAISFVHYLFSYIGLLIYSLIKKKAYINPLNGKILAKVNAEIETTIASNIIQTGDGVRVETTRMKAYHSTVDGEEAFYVKFDNLKMPGIGEKEIYPALALFQDEKEIPNTKIALEPGKWENQDCWFCYRHGTLTENGVKTDQALKATLFIMETGSEDPLCHTDFTFSLEGLDEWINPGGST
ncbi:MAG: hypothetical protein JW969_04770 [Spirochaetales bacterium]|nr:hypothetical protein [Spirochaetales bacterium]